MKKTALISFSTFILTVILSFVNPPIGPLNSEVKSANETYIPLTETRISEARLNARKKVVQRNAELYIITKNISEDVRSYMIFENDEGDGNPADNEVLRNTLKKNFDTFDNFSARYKNTVLSWVGKSRDLDKNYIMQEVVDEYVGFKSYVINLGKTLPYLLVVFSFFSITIHLLID